MTHTSALKRFVPGMMALKISASAFVLGATLASCTTADGNRPAAYSAKAEKALAKGNAQVALTNAEAAVLADPRNAGYRSSLGQAYLANGRFLSAARTFEDAMELGDESPRTVISMALAQIANGNSQDAQFVLSQYQTILPGGDYGLALALAGDTRQGVNVLENEVRNGANSGKVRQNLAMAYALDGKWREARAMAMQDVAPAEVDARLLQWVQMAPPESYQQRVAALLGVTPQADAGQPARLALANTPEMAAAIADITAPETEADMQFADANPNALESPDSLASYAGEPTQFAMAEENNVAVAPLIEAMQAPVKIPAQTVAAPTPAPSVAAPASGSANVANGAYIVQLGAFSSVSGAERAWKIYNGRHVGLKSFDYAQSQVQSGGRTLYRLAAAGFGNAGSAMSLCNDIKAKGGNCIVRQVGNSSPVRMASRK